MYTCMLDLLFNLCTSQIYKRPTALFLIVTLQVTHEQAKCIRLLPAHSYTAVGFNSGLVTIFSFVLASQGFGKVGFISGRKVL